MVHFILSILLGLIFSLISTTALGLWAVENIYIFVLLWGMGAVVAAFIISIVLFILFGTKYKNKLITTSSNLVNTTSLLIGAILASVISYNCNLCTKNAQVYIPILLFIGLSILGALAIILTLFIISLFVNKSKPVKNPNKIWFFLYNVIIEFLVFWSGIKLKVNQKVDLQKGPYLFVFNHRSNFDPIVVSMVFRNFKPLMVSKKANFDIPIAGAAIHKICFVCMPREDNRAALKVILDCANRLKEGEYSIGICPEGTRNKNRRDLLPFRNGCFKIATKANVPIAVICLEGTEKVAKRFPRRTTVKLDLLEVITPEEYKDLHTNDIGDQVYNIIYKNINDFKPLDSALESTQTVNKEVQNSESSTTESSSDASVNDTEQKNNEQVS